MSKFPITNEFGVYFFYLFACTRLLLSRRWTHPELVLEECSQVGEVSDVVNFILVEDEVQLFISPIVQRSRRFLRFHIEDKLLRP